MKRNFLPTTRAGKLSVVSFILYFIAIALAGIIKNDSIRITLSGLGGLFFYIALIAGIVAIRGNDNRNVLVYLSVILPIIIVGIGIALALFISGIPIAAVFVVLVVWLLVLVLVLAKWKGRKK